MSWYITVLSAICHSVYQLTVVSLLAICIVQRVSKKTVVGLIFHNLKNLNQYSQFLAQYIPIILAAKCMYYIPHILVYIYLP